MKPRLPVLIGAGLAAGAAVMAIGALTGRWEGLSGGAEEIAEGRAIYEAHCAACHGAQFEGQPDLRSPLPSGRLSAPPHSATGHTWPHPDQLLIRIVKEDTSAERERAHQENVSRAG